MDALDLEGKVIRFLAEWCGANPASIGPEAFLRDDLGLEGDDAEELVCAFAERFQVDLAEYRHDRYFGPEVGSLGACGVLAVWGAGVWGVMKYSWPLGLLAIGVSGYAWVLWCRHFPDERTPLPCGALVEAARLGRWPGDGEAGTEPGRF